MVIQGRFGLLPAAWVTRDDLGLDEIGVLACLSIYADRDGWCFPKQATLARHLKRSRPWIIKILNRLVDYGLIERFHQFSANGAQLACRYRLLRNQDPTPSCHDQDAPVPESKGECHPENTKQDQIQHINSLPRTSSKVTDSVTPSSSPAQLHLKSTTQTLTPPPSAKTLVARTWQPTSDDLTWAQARYPRVALEYFTEKFINACHAKDYRYVDHSSAWRLWLSEENPRQPILCHTSKSNQSRTSSSNPAKVIFPSKSTAERNRQTSSAVLERFYHRYDTPAPDEANAK
ncbi:MAG: helix-turn-helix domain-containing protein [Acidobacteriaceae bacterium]|nr:helix-turn-helix domain-containing protein [Acidobacteriaceae bacterium]